MHTEEAGISMRVRPFFWLLLSLTCLGVLLFAAIKPVHVPAIMQVRIEQQPPTSAGFTAIVLHLTDTQGLPIEEAQVSSIAQMTNMSMISNQSSVKYVGEGNYITRIRLYMAGPWAITVQAQADGFESIHQQMLIQVI